MKTPAAEAPASEDVIDLLIKQHAQIRDLFLAVAMSGGLERRKAFDRLVRLLAVHETAEEQIVHPLARRTLFGGEGIVEDRLTEEGMAKAILAELENMDTDDPRFLGVLNQLRGDVLTHARAEERYEFVGLRAQFSETERRGLCAALRAAEAVAPIHPHPGIESAAKNLLAGPAMALADRVRDLIRDAMKRPKSGG
ncbi:hemerythrin domain-containing protein [Actinomadura sp. HBU206391]|uniref:hemerythrin domain-containing protein n=1 Tax=Actinomadura sp. HBU206391 TaxID=2731692 RepID=UPI00164F2889|nr:hemerythrin domain-containing protein [Actinomadura sp. HBU206391]MBC6462162.1 hemerythrin domain-containing protein [Actinomadura sp. HBU206391]